MLCVLGKDKSWLVTCLGPSWTCACRVCSSCLVRWSSPTTETQTQLCEQRSWMGKCGHPSCEGEPTNRKADELGNWACKWNLGVCQLVFLWGPKIEKIFVLWKPVANVNIEFREIRVVVWQDCWLFLMAGLFLTAPSPCPVPENTVAFLSRCELSQQHGAGQTLGLGDKEPSTALWDQTALAPNAGRQNLLHVAWMRQANNTPQQGDRCTACTPGAPLLPHYTHTQIPTPLCH